jgi:predicted CXXCH cytochrome family protein
MDSARANHTLTVLADGRVLVAGGEDSSKGVLRASLVYDPAIRSFSDTAPLITARIGHTATRLPGGKVLIAGGYDGSAFLSSCEIYDPSRGTFAPTGSMGTARRSHTATLLPSGKVLVAGGSAGKGVLASVELYDPSTGRFATLKPMGSPREGHTATLLSGGRVLVAGGHDGRAALRSTEIYGKSFKPAASMGTARRNATATPLPGGRVLIAGGENDGRRLPSAEIYDPSRDWFEETESMANARARHFAAPMPGGTVLVAGGDGDDPESAEIFDPVSGSFSNASPMGTKRRLDAVALLPGGRVLAVGGREGPSPLASSETFLPSPPRFDADGDGKTDFVLWRPATGAWRTKPSGGGTSSETVLGEQARGDVPVPGDYDGDWIVDPAVWRSTDGSWIVKPSSGGPTRTVRWPDSPSAADIPTPGDYDGDGRTDFAVWRPSNGTWYVKTSSGAAWNETQWGDASMGDIPVPGDYDGDGRTDPAYWRPSDGVWHIKPSSGGAQISTQWGVSASGDTPVQGDFDGDGRTDLAVFRPSKGLWYIKPSSGAPSLAIQWGVEASGDIPVQGDFDGDGKTDPAVWRASNGNWYVKPSSGAATITSQWGETARQDKPVNRPVHLWRNLPPSAPANLAAEGGGRRVTLSWSPAAGAVAYRLYWALSPGVTRTTGILLDNVATPYRHAGLKDGTTYYYAVTAIGPGGQESAFSSEAEAATSRERLAGPDVGQYFDRLSGTGNFADNSSHPLRGMTTPDTTLRFSGTQDCLECHYAASGTKSSDECLMCHFENQPNAPAGNHRDGVLQMAAVRSNALPTSQFAIGTLAEYDAWCLQCHGSDSIELGRRSADRANRTLIDGASVAGGRHRANGAGCIHCHDPHGSGNARLVRPNPLNRAAAKPVPERFGLFPTDNTGINGSPQNQNVFYRARVEKNFADAADVNGYCNKACHIARVSSSWSKERMRKRVEDTGLYVLAGAKKISIVENRDYTMDNATSRMHAHSNNDIISTDDMVTWFAQATGSTGPGRYHYPGRPDADPSRYKNIDSPIPLFPDFTDGSRDFLNGYSNQGPLKYRYTCVTCHDPHGSPDPALNGIGNASYPDLRMKKSSELCVQCHR